LERIVFGLLHLQAVVGYLTESPGFNTFARDDGAVYHTYSTTWKRARRGSSRSAGTTSTKRAKCGRREPLRLRQTE
jgi:hypothetical protein